MLLFFYNYCGYFISLFAIVYEIESDIGSPVDLAKSYMQSKPPWESPFLTSSSTLFSTQPSGSSKFSGGFIHGTFDHFFSSSRVFIRTLSLS